MAVMALMAQALTGLQIHPQLSIIIVKTLPETIPRVLKRSLLQAPNLLESWRLKHKRVFIYFVAMLKSLIILMFRPCFRVSVPFFFFFDLFSLGKVKSFLFDLCSRKWCLAWKSAIAFCLFLTLFRSWISFFQEFSLIILFHRRTINKRNKKYSGFSTQKHDKISTKRGIFYAILIFPIQK